MRILTLLSAIILFLVVISCMRDLRTALLKAGEEVSWQQSTAPQIQLGARDKFGSLGTYAATFTVKDLHGHEYRAEKNGAQDNWTFVYFPADFPTAAGDGKFIWNCRVNGRIIGKGAFSMTFDSLKISD